MQKKPSGDMHQGVGASVPGKLCDRCLDAIARHLWSPADEPCPDESRSALDAVASWAYSAFGVAAEVRIQDGSIGVAAREKVAILTDQMSPGHPNGSAVSDRLRVEAGPALSECQGVDFPDCNVPKARSPCR